ncbi:MAG: cation diffusion facilitator family transporter [Methylobacterium sp.]|uniref:cation diffusion facilitator family transporter n=1 Tax=Methylobacterium sp. TaxID=409 RepID=UPI0025ED77CC|nr:cation diffusion facilitator family transporter [Methylobacterium sp.]MBX9933849.1 cation diffusion facilitator family transporter [Methylobacterium sp.]
MAAHAHDHRHGAHHRHDHAPASFGRAFAVGIVLNTGFVIVEAGYGIASQSMSLLADAGHNLSDVLALVVAWTASRLVKRDPTARYTYGLAGSSILAALFNALFLLLATGMIIWEAILRLLSPAPVAGATVMAVAAIGIVINGITAWLFSSGRRGDINIRGAYLHMLADAAVSAGVVAAGLVILLTGFNWLDPLVSLVIAGLIVWSSWGLLRDSMAMALSAVPAQIEPDEIRDFLRGRPGVADLHDVHVWPISTTETALTAHLVMEAGHPGNAFLVETARELSHRYGIGHTTLQIEDMAGPPCALASACRP